MIKSGQIEELAKAGFHYITAITKPQIDTLLSGGVLQLALFDDSLCEVEQESVRYVLRRNPVRARKSPPRGPANKPAWPHCSRSATSISPSMPRPK